MEVRTPAEKKMGNASHNPPPPTPETMPTPPLRNPCLVWFNDIRPTLRCELHATNYHQFQGQYNFPDYVKYPTTISN